MGLYTRKRLLCEFKRWKSAAVVNFGRQITALHSDAITLKRMALKAEGVECVLIIKANSKQTQYIPPEYFYELALLWEKDHFSTASSSHMQGRKPQKFEIEAEKEEERRQAETANQFIEPS